ncbi:MAG: hypothetical protein JW929_12770 [Anaerolineales bacterium]|nr:hypothetical protein [Anaerolineales bacterium]
MAVAGLAILLSPLARKPSADGWWRWILRLGEGAAGAAVFLGMLWGFRGILNSNTQTFFSTHGSQSEISRESAYTIWGRPHVQGELSVKHYITVEEEELIPQKDPEAAPQYRTVEKIVEVPQASIRSFRGEAGMTLSEREKGYAYYSGYLLHAEYHYRIRNESDLRTDAHFEFALSRGQPLFQDFAVSVDGTDIGRSLQFSGNVLFWRRNMAPGEEIAVDISYDSRGMDYFYYSVLDNRFVDDFEFTLTIDRLPTTLLNYPDGVLTPTEVRPTEDGNGSVLTWRLNHAITNAGMGVSLIRPEQPGEKVLRLLVNSPIAITILGSLLALMIVLLGAVPNLMDLVLVSAVYCVEYLMMAGISDSFLGFWGALGVGAALTFFLAFLLFRRSSSRLRKTLVLVLVAFFALAYPLSGLIDQIAVLNSFNALLLAGIILYLFALTLYSRQRAARD